ncbi:MAG: TonB-dependent receptor [Alphaproteobacteria bacterium]|nr:TonB-dependent receptor [Alphaproteobacteria bacterium]
MAYAKMRMNVKERNLNNKKESYIQSVKTCLAFTLFAFVFQQCVSMQIVQAQTEPSDEAVIDAIVVTATKRAESIQSVGLSISAISGEDLQARGAVDFEDYALTVPNLAFGATDDGILANRTISIRGIEGLNTTGFYIDDVPIDESIDPLVLDVERVEVLRGPQGTLYGARGLGGTVRIVTKQPEFDEVSGRVHFGLSNTDEGGLNYVVDGAVNIPLSEKFAIRFTGYQKYDEGIFDKIVGPALTAPGVSGMVGAPGAISGDNGPLFFENVDDKTTFGAQLAMRLEASDNLEVLVKFLMQRTKLDGFPLADFTYDADNPPRQIVLKADDFTQERLFNIAETGEDEWFQTSLTLNYETDIGRFTSSTGYFRRKTEEGEDSSAFVSFTLPETILGGLGGITRTASSAPIYQRLNFTTFVEELRFVSNFESPFQVTTGLFYQDTGDDEDFYPPNYARGAGVFLSRFIEARFNFPAGSVPPNDLIFTSFRPSDIEELGAYAEFSYDITDQFTATLGARYYDTETSFNDTRDGFANGGPSTTGVRTQAEDGVNLKALFEYQANEDLYFYTSAAQGFRIGGASGGLPAALDCPAQAARLGFSVDDAGSYDSDDLWSYELGAKSTWADGRVILNGAIFRVDFDDIQQVVLLSCGFPFTTNAGEAQSEGFEIEASFLLTDNLFIQLAAGYTDAEFTEDVAQLFKSGDKLQQIPEWTYSFTADYEFDVSANYNGFARADFSYVDESISRVVDLENPRMRPAYEILNLRAGVRSSDYEFYAFIDNALDEDAVFADNRTLAAEATGRPRVVRNRPRTIGVGLRGHF